MHWKFEQRVPKFEVAHLRVKEGDILRVVKRRMMDEITDKLLETITITEHDPLHRISDKQMLNEIGPFGSAETDITFRAEVVHLPIEQWTHIKGLLRTLQGGGPVSNLIVQEIIREVETK